MLILARSFVNQLITIITCEQTISLNSTYKNSSYADLPPPSPLPLPLSIHPIHLSLFFSPLCCVCDLTTCDITNCSSQPNIALYINNEIWRLHLHNIIIIIIVITFSFASSSTSLRNAILLILRERFCGPSRTRWRRSSSRPSRRTSPPLGETRR